MAPKGLHSRARETGGIHVPAHPMVPGTARPSSEGRTLREIRLGLRELADDAIDHGEDAEAAELLLRLGASLCTTQEFTAGLLVLDEALDRARASGERALVDRVVSSLDRAIMGASAN